MSKVLHVLGYLNGRQVVSRDLALTRERIRERAMLAAKLPWDRYAPEPEDIEVIKESIIQDAIKLAPHMTSAEIGKFVSEIGKQMMSAKGDGE